MCVWLHSETQRELEERTHEVLDMDNALKERQGELQQRAQLVQHTHKPTYFLCISFFPPESVMLTSFSLYCLFFNFFVFSARPAGRGHQRTQAGDGEEGGVPAAEPGRQRQRAEGHTQGTHRQKREGQEEVKGAKCAIKSSDMSV